MSCGVTVAVLLAVTVSVAASVVDPVGTEGRYQCTGYCKGSNKFKYVPGTTYTYDYKAHTSTSIRGAMEEKSQLHLSATAHFHVASQCDFILQLENVQLADSDLTTADSQSSVQRSAQFSTALEKNSLRFSFQDGTVDELCADEDPVWVLNIKRGVLSAFQNSMHDLSSAREKHHETDVTGTCETNYDVILEEDEFNRPLLRVGKMKNLLACSHRMDHFLTLQSTPYLGSSAQSLPLIKSQQRGSQIIADSILKKATNNEIHTFRPFSKHESGAVTMVNQILTFQTSHTEGLLHNPGTAPFRRTTLLYENVDSTDKKLNLEDTAKEILENLVNKTSHGVESDVPAIFSHLVATLNSMNSTELTNVFSYSTGKNTRKFLLDAMPHVTTADGAVLMTSLFKSNVITSEQMDSWLISLAFQKKPTLSTISSVSFLLDRTPSAKGLLGISALIHNYCQYDKDCFKREQVKDVMIKMERLLGQSCESSDHTTQKLIVLSLKAIGNAGIFTGSTETLRKCFQNKNPTEVRLAAISAYRRLPCSEHTRSHLLDLYTDKRQDTELRIASYLAVMQCPSSQIIRRIINTLYSEDVNQVASFVWTHLTNLQETSSHWKQNIRALVSNDFLRNKFKTDVRKFSRNYEGSFFSESLNAGAAAESNIVFTPQSYLPRSATLNLTLDLFGESFNVLEIGGRAEGFESIVESMFGPEGYFPDKAVGQMLKKLRDESNTDSVENSITKLASDFDAGRKQGKSPSASLYTRVFGNELQYTQFHGLEEVIASIKDVTSYDFVRKIAQQKDIDFTKSMVLIDGSYTIPTCIGLPMKLVLNGSATVGFKLQGHANIKDLFALNSIDIEGHVAPSAAVAFSGTMAVDAAVTKSGVKLVNTLHTNTHMGGKIKIQGGEIVDLKLNVPHKKTEMLHIESQLYVLHRDHLIESKGIKKNIENYKLCSTDFIGSVTGMKSCMELTYVNSSLHPQAPYFPLTGPFKFLLDVTKVDTFDSYDFIFKHQKGLSSGKSMNSTAVSLYFDTPGSNVDRKLSAQYVLDWANSAAKASLLTPFIKIAASGKLENSDSFKLLDTTVVLNSQELFATRLGLKKNQNGHTGRYEPFFAMSYRKKLIADITGKVNYAEGSKYSADLVIKGLSEEQISVKGDLNINEDKYDVTGNIKSKPLTSTIHGSLRFADNSLSTKVTVQYKIGKSQPHTLGFSAKLQDNSKGTLTRNNLHLTLQMTQFPDYNIDALWDLQHSRHYLDSSGRLAVGDRVWYTQQLYRFQSTEDVLSFDVECTLKCPKLNVDYGVAINNQVTNATLSSHFMMTITPLLIFSTNVDYSHMLRDELHQHFLAADVRCPWFSAGMNSTLNEMTPGRHEIQLTIWSGTARLDVSGTYSDGSNKAKTEHHLDLTMAGLFSGNFSAGLVSSSSIKSQWIQLDINNKTYVANVTYIKDIFHFLEITVRLAESTYGGSVVLLSTAVEKGFAVDLKLRKRINMATKITLDGKKHGLQFELFWDKDANPNKKISLVAQAEGNKKEVLLEIPGRYLKGEVVTVAGGATGYLEWAEHRKISAQLEWNLDEGRADFTAKISTPFPRMESLYLYATYTLMENEAVFLVDTSWQKQRLSVTISVKRINNTSDVWGWKVGAHMESTVPGMQHVSLNLDHNARTDHQRTIKTTALLKYNGKQSTFEANWKSDKSSLFGDIKLNSPIRHLEFLKHTLNFTDSSKETTGSLEMNWSRDSKIISEFVVKKVDGAAGSFRIVTPFVGYEVTSAEYNFTKLQDSDGTFHVKMEAQAVFKDYLTMFDISGSKTKTSLGGTLQFKTPFTDEFRVDALHQLYEGRLNETILFSLAEVRLLYLYFVGEVHTFPNFQLSAGAKIPNQNVHVALRNHLLPDSLESSCEGKWNDNNITVSAIGRYVNSDNVFSIHFDVTANSTVLPRSAKLAFDHICSAGTFQTSLLLPADIKISNTFTTSDSLNWENNLKFQTPKKIGSVINRQRFRDGLTLEHEMTASLNDQQASGTVTFVRDTQSAIVKEAKAVIVTPWTDPVTILYKLPVDTSDIRPSLILQFRRNKEIRIEAEIQYQLQHSKLYMQIISPFHKPVLVNASYHLGGTNFKGLILTQWESKKLNVTSHMQFDHNLMKSSGDFSITHSDLAIDVLSGSFSYNLVNPEITAHALGAHRDHKLGFGLTLLLEKGVYKGSLTVQTPFKNWENLSLSGQVNLVKPTKLAVMTLSRNLEDITMSGLFSSDVNSSKFSVALTSHIPSFPSVSLYGSYDISSSNNHIYELNCDSQGKKIEFYAQVQLDEDSLLNSMLAESTLKTPFDGYETVSAHLSYDIKGKEKRFDLKLVKSSWKFIINSKCVFGPVVGTGGIKVELPFEDLKEMSLSVRYALRPSSQERTLSIFMSRNELEVEMAGTLFVGNDGSLTAGIGIKSPIEGYKKIACNIALSASPERRSMALVFSKDQEQYMISGTFTSNTEARLIINTPLKDYDKIEFKTGYIIYGEDTLNSNIKRKVYASLDMPIGKSEISIDLDLRKLNSIISASMASSLLMIPQFEMRGQYDFRSFPASFGFSTTKDSVNFMSMQFTVEQNRLIGEITTPFEGYQKIGLLGTLRSKENNKVTHLKLNIDEHSFELFSTVALGTKSSDIRAELITTKPGFERLVLHGQYDLSESEKSAELTISLDPTTTYELFISGAADTLSGQLKIQVFTPLSDYQNVVITARYNLTQDYYANFVVEKNGSKTNFGSHVVFSDDGTVLRIETPFQQVKDISLHMYSTYQTENDASSARLTVTKDGILTVLDTSFQLSNGIAVIKVNTPFETMRELIVTTDMSSISMYEKESEISISVLRNSEHFLRASSSINLDWDNEVNALLKLDTPILSNFSLSLSFVPAFPPSKMQLTVNKNDKQILNFRSEFITKSRDFSYDFELTSLVREKLQYLLTVGFSPNEKYMAFNIEMLSAGQKNQYVGDIRINKNNCELSAVLKTPIKGYENFSLKWKHSYGFIDGKLITPFEGYENQTLTAHFEIQSKRKSVRFFISRNENIIDVRTSLDRGNDGNKLKIHITTPFSTFKKFEVQLLNVKSDAKNKIGLSIGLNDKYLKTEGELELRKNMLEAMFALSSSLISVPVSDIKVKIFYDLSKSITMGSILEVGDMSVNASCAIDFDFLQGEILGSFTKTEQIKERKIVWSLENDAIIKSAKISAILTDEINVDVYAQLQISSTDDIKLQVSIAQTQNNNLPPATGTLKLEWNIRNITHFNCALHILEDDEVLFGLDINVALKKSIEFKYSGILFYFIPCTLQINYRAISDDHVELSSKLYFENNAKESGLLHFSLMPHTASISAKYKKVFFSFRYDLTPAYKRLDFIYQVSEIRYALSTNLTLSKAALPLASITLQTPIYNYHFIHVSNEYMINSTNKGFKILIQREESNGEISLMLWKSKHSTGIKANISLPIPSRCIVHPLTSFNMTSDRVNCFWDSMKHVSLYFKYEPGSLLANIDTPLTGLVDLVVELFMENAGTGKVNCSVNYGEKNILLYGAYDLTHENKPEVKVIFNSPWTKSYILNGKYENGTASRFTMVLQKENKVTILDVELKYDMEDTEFKIDVGSIAEVYMRYDFKGKAAYFEVKAARFSLTFDGSLGTEQITARLQVRTPFDSYKDISAEGIIDIGQSGALTLTCNRKTYSLQGELKDTHMQGKLNGHFSVVTPYLKFDKIAFDIEYDDESGYINIGSPGEVLYISGSYNFGKRSYFVRTTLKVPSVEVMNHVSFSTSLDAENHTVLVTAQWTPSKVIVLSAQLLQSNLSIILETPFAGMDRIVATGAFKNETTQLSLQGKIAFGTDEQNVGLHLIVGKRQLQYSLFSNMLPFIEINHNITLQFGDKKHMFAKFTSGDANTEHLFIAEGVLNLKEMSMKLKLQVQHVVIVEYEGHLTYTSWRDVKISVTKTVFDTVTLFEGSYVISKTKFIVKCSEVSPESKRSLIIGGSYEYNKNGIKGELYLNNDTLSASYKLNDTSLIASFKLNSESILNIEDINIKFEGTYVPDLHGSLIYKYDTYSGKLEIALEQTEKITTARGAVSLNPFFSPSNHTILVAYGMEDQQGFVRFVYEGKATEFISVSYQIEDKMLEVRVDVNSKILGRHRVLMLLKNNWKTAYLEIANVFSISLRVSQYEGSLAVTTGATRHEASYRLANDQGYHGRLELVTPLATNGKIVMTATTKNGAKRNYIELKGISGSIIYRAALELNYKVENKTIALEIVSASKSVLSLNAFLKLDGGTVKARALLDLLGVTSSAELQHTWALPLKSGLTVTSPYIPNGVMQFTLNMENDSLVLFGGFGGIQYGQYVMLKGAINLKEGTVYFNFKSPPLSLIHSAGINGIYKGNEGGSYNVEFSCHFSSQSVSSSELSARFQLSSRGIDMAARFVPPWQDSENYGLTILIPFTLSNDMKPRVALDMGKNNMYSMHGVFVNVGNVQEVGFGAQYQLRKLGGSLKIENSPITNVQADIDLPLGDNKGHYGFNIRAEEGQNLLGVENTLNYTHIGIHWEDKEIELRYSLSYVGTDIDEMLHCTLIMQITTPFQGYEQNGLKLHVNLSPSQSLIISSINYPGKLKPFGFELNYHLKGYNDVSFVSQLHIPFIPALEDVALVFSSKYEENLGHFRSVLGGHWKEEELAITLESDLAEKIVLKGSVTFKLLGQTYSLHTSYGSSKTNILGPFIVRAQLTSPIKVLKNAEVYIEVDLLKSVIASVTHNSEELLGFRVYSDEVTLFAVEVRNPWRSAYFQFGYDISKDIMIQAELSWDINGKNKSQIGIIFALASGPNEKKDLSATLKLPTRVLVFNLTQLLSPVNIEYSGSFSWKKGQIIGFKTATKMNSSTEGFKLSTLNRVDFPFRSFEVESHASARLDTGTLKYADVGAEFLWDALGNRNKKIGIELRHYSPTVEIVLRHAALENDLVIRVEKNGKLAYSDLPFRMKMEIEYSPEPEDLISLETHVQNSVDASSGIDVGFTLRHIPTNTDFRAGAEIMQTSRDCSAQVLAEYLNSYTRQKHRIEIVGKISSHRPEFQFAVRTVENRLEVHGLLQSSDTGYYGAFLEFLMNQKEPLSVEASVNTAEPRAELEARYGNSRSYKIYAGVPHSREITFSMKRVMYGSEYEDVAVILRLNTSQQLWSRIKWQPRALSDLKTGLLQEYSDVNHVIQSIGSGFTDVWLKDVAYKGNIIYTVLADATEHIGSTSMTELGAIYKDVLNVGEEMTAMYNRNDFYLKDMQPYFNKTVSYIKEKASGICQLLFDGVESVFLAIKDFIVMLVNSLQIDFSRVFHILNDFKVVVGKAVTYVLNFVEEVKKMHATSKQYLKAKIEALRTELVNVEENMKRLVDFVHNYLIDLVTKYIELLEPYLTKVENTMELLSRRVIDFEDKISEYILDMVQTLMGAEEVQELIAFYNKYASWLEELHLQDYVIQLTKLLQSIQRLVMQDIQRVCSDYLDYINYVANVVNDIYNNINTMPMIAYTRRAINFVYDKVRWVWEHYELSNLLKSQIHDWIENLDKLLLRLLNAIDMDASSPTKSLTPSITLRPDIGLVEYSQKLPIDWHGFNELPKFQQLQLYEQAKDHANEIASLDRYRYYLMDTLYDITNNISMTSVLPPFSAFGMIAGNKHYITFDNKFYDFTGDCSYLLASDLLNNRFSAFVTYEIKDRKAVKKSLTVLVDSYRIEINANKHVTIDGQRVELPVEVNSQTWVKRTGERIVVHSDLGLEVDCNLYHDICTVELSGWYFGKTGGLLGTFDYEPTNDMSLPNGTIAQSVQTFADSWHVGSARCRSANHASTSTNLNTEVKSLSDSNQCTDYFEEPLSPLRPCFSRVETDPFYKMCLSELGNNRTDGVCLSVAAYVSQCKRTGVDIMLPHTCVHCATSNGNTMKAGQLEVFHGESVKAADIVFVVEQSPCIKKINLAELLSKLNSAMSHQGLDTRFSVVGFGGNKFREPHTRTSNGEIWSSLKGAEKTLRSLQTAVSETTDSETLSAFSALWFASHLPFRTASSKTIVLVQCAACQDTGDDYSAMINTLLENDITLHILQPQALKPRSGKDKINQVYGVDLNGAFSSRSLKSLMPSFPLLRQVALPKDICTPLAFETNGTLFNIDRLMQADRNTHRVNAKKFIDVWARRITQTAKPTPCQKCQCVANEDGVGQIMCSKCLSPSIEHLLKQWENLKEVDQQRLQAPADYVDYPL